MLWFINRHRLELTEAVLMHAAMARAVAEGDGAGAVRALNGIIAVLENLIQDLDGTVT